MKVKNVKIACIQFKPELNQKISNVDKMQKAVKSAIRQYPGVELIVFPELSTTGYECGENFALFAESITDSSAYSINRMSEVAKEYHVNIIYGFPEKIMQNEEECICNSQILIDKDGLVVGSYQKVHLFDTEKKFFTPGNEYKVFETSVGKIGMFICYDAFFPEVARILTLRGANILVNSTNWEDPKAKDMDLVMRARAIENTTFLVCCNRVGTDQNLSFFGHSQIIDPLGEVLAIQKCAVEDIIYSQVNYEYSEYLKNNYYTMLQERRTDTYEQLIKETKYL